MKHTFRTLIAILLGVCLCLSFAGCGGSNGNGSGTTPSGHTHTFAAEWSHDEEKHWHAATCGHDSERSGEAAHNYQNGKCTECKYEHTAHTFGAYEKTEGGHSRTCTVCKKTVSAAHTYRNGKCTECEYEPGEHTFGAYEKTESGHSRTCSDCGKTEDANHTYENGKCKICDYAHQNHTYGTDNVCEVCGAKKPYSKSADGTKIYFGEYPQSEVKESGLKGMLGMQAGANPTSENAGKWTDYGYYIESEVQSYMWYIDVDYQGSRYRGVYFTNYRPKNTRDASSADNSYQDEYGYNTNTVYWFKYEPIEWRILEEKSGTAFLMANIILDSQQFYYRNSGERTLNGKTIYLNSYTWSDIRKWLNGTFYETAFEVSAQVLIETTEVDNSASTTARDNNPCACEDTQDKIFLLSHKDAVNPAYGFSSDEKNYDENRQFQSTDYAKSQGLYRRETDDEYAINNKFWLRSPYYLTPLQYAVNCIGTDGRCSTYLICAEPNGVVPALWIKL